ncbi:MAG: hypothetical protein HZB35_03770 [Nitrospirae bacterium]|nr:hypothetical protein [Nitrospirota bacterium]
MFKIKKPAPKAKKDPILYDVIEDYTEYDPPGNLTACAMTKAEDPAAHAKVLAESYEIPQETVARLLADGGVYTYPETGPLVTKGWFVCRTDPSVQLPKLTWVLDLMQVADAQQLMRSYGLSADEAAYRVLLRTLSPDLRTHIEQNQFVGTESGRDQGTPSRVTYVDCRKDWSPHFKRLCIMPDGRMVETGGLTEFATLHGITEEQAKKLVEDGGTLEVNGEVLACQIVNGQPVVARFNAKHYAKAKDIVGSKGVHLMDALSEVGLSDPAMMRGLAKLERRFSS